MHFGNRVWRHNRPETCQHFICTQLQYHCFPQNRTDILSFLRLQCCVINILYRLSWENFMFKWWQEKFIFAGLYQTLIVSVHFESDLAHLLHSNLETICLYGVAGATSLSAASFNLTATTAAMFSWIVFQYCGGMDLIVLLEYGTGEWNFCWRD